LQKFLYYFDVITVLYDQLIMAIDCLIPALQIFLKERILHHRPGRAHQTFRSKNAGAGSNMGGYPEIEILNTVQNLVSTLVEAQYMIA